MVFSVAVGWTSLGKSATKTSWEDKHGFGRGDFGALPSRQSAAVSMTLDSEGGVPRRPLIPVRVGLVELAPPKGSVVQSAKPWCGGIFSHSTVPTPLSAPAERKDQRQGNVDRAMGPCHEPRFGGRSSTTPTSTGQGGARGTRPSERFSSSKREALVRRNLLPLQCPHSFVGSGWSSKTRDKGMWTQQWEPIHEPPPKPGGADRLLSLGPMARSKNRVG